MPIDIVCDSCDKTVYSTYDIGSFQSELKKYRISNPCKYCETKLKLDPKNISVEIVSTQKKEKPKYGMPILLIQ